MSISYVVRTFFSQFWCYQHRCKICGNKMPTRCNRGFYCGSYCLLNMFWTSLCPSSGAQEYYTVVAACGISCCKNVKNNFVIQSHPKNGIPDPQTKLYTTKKPTKNTHTQLPWHSTHLVRNLDNTRHLRLRTQIPQKLTKLFFFYIFTARNTTGSNHCIILELLMMGIVVPETCWASNRNCNKNLCCI